MAIELSGTGEWYKRTGSVISAYPFTMAAHFNTTSIATGNTILALSKSSSTNNYFRLYASQFGDELWMQGGNLDDGGNGNSVQVDSPSVSNNTWYTAIGTANGVDPTNDWEVYLDGNGKGTSSTNGDTAYPTGQDRTDIGTARSDNDKPFNGQLAEIAIWDVVLTAAERAMYDNYVSPLLIRPQNLVFYVPGVGTPIDLISNTVLTASGTPQITAHRPIIYPSAQILQFPTAAVAGGLSIPVAVYHYNHNIGSN